MSSFPRTGTELQRRKRHALSMTPATELTSTKDQLRLFLGNVYMGGVWHGAVASEAAMLALNATKARGCWPHDMCRRTDLYGTPVMICIAGNGLLTAEWESLGGSGGSGGGGAAADITYDPTTSELEATNVQAAIDEIVAGGGGWVEIADGDIPPGGEIHVCGPWVSNGDANGVIYRLATAWGSSAWANPHTSGAVVVILRQGWTGISEAGFVDRATQNGYGAGSNGEWIVVDLKSAVALTSYSLQVYTSAGYRPRNWKLQGSNDVASNTVAGVNVATWVDIDVRVSDATIPDGSATWGHFTFTSAPAAYRWYRVIMTGPESNGTYYFTVNEIEVYADSYAETVPRVRPPGSRCWLTDGEYYVPAW